MKFYLGILLILTVCLVASPTGTVWACAEAVAFQEQEKASSANDHCTPTTADPCNDIHPGQNCPPDTDGCGHCHCPGCGTSGGMTFAGFFKHTFSELPVPDWSYDRRAANFFYNAPSTSAYVNTLFQPPRV